MEGGGASRFCYKCGAMLADDAAFCHACGAAVVNVRRDEFSVSTDRLVERVKQLVHEGNVTRIIIKDEAGRILLDVPFTAGFVGLLLAPILAAVGAIAAIATKCTVVVERREEPKPGG